MYGTRSQVILASLLINILALALPLALLQVYDRIIPSQGYATVTALTFGVLLALGYESALRLSRSYLMGKISQRFERAAGRAAISHLLATDLEAFEQVDNGTHMERVTALTHLRDYYSGQSILALYDLPFAFIYISIIYFLGGPLVWIPIALLAAYLLVALFIGLRLKTVVELQTHAENSRLGFLIGVIGGIHTVKAMAMENKLARRYERLQEERAGITLEVELKSSIMVDIGTALSQATTVLTVAIGAVLVIKGQLSTGALSACLLMAGRTLQPLQNAVGFWTRFQSIVTARQQLEALFDIRVPASNPNPEAPQVLQGAISLRNMSFQFTGAPEPVLRNIDLEIASGEMVAFIGANGSGKTVLLSLLAGLLEPTEGSVQIDGWPLSEIEPRVLKQQLAFLPQREYLFRGSILDNISLFRPELRDRAVALANAFGLAEKVSVLPMGYRTMVGDSAQEFLPRGVVQQIALVRALAVEPRILLFDEANTALDDRADSKLKQQLLRLKGNMTLVVVSHRPSVLWLADRVYRVDQGQLTLEKLPAPGGGGPPATTGDGTAAAVSGPAAGAGGGTAPTAANAPAGPKATAAASGGTAA